MDILSLLEHSLPQCHPDFLVEFVDLAVDWEVKSMCAVFLYCANEHV